MSLSRLVDPGLFPDDGLMSLAMSIIRIVAYSALGVVVVGFLATCCCCLFDGRMWKGCEGRSVLWRLMH